MKRRGRAASGAPLAAVTCWLMLFASAITTLPPSRPASALPLYTARAGRTCDNCHSDPTGWENPELSKRKCNLSCLTCHVNPSGGGLRRAPGRFYGQATLPMALASHRPHEDWTRNVSSALHPKTRRNRVGDPALGRPLGGSSPLAHDESRYAGLRADPFVLAGIDLRLATWVIDGAALFFPMQLDVHLAVRPVRHLTVYTTAGVLAKSQGFVPTFGLDCRPENGDADCFSRARGTPFMVKDLFLMVDQLPYSGYVRVGRFVPPFGLAVADHTVSTRREFELNHGLMHSRVFGAEVGVAPNYPYAHLGVFRPNRQDRFVDDPDVTSPDELPPFAGVGGWGMSAALGWRDLGYQVGLSALMRRRELQDGGDTESVALSFGFNPWHYLPWLPLTYLGELAFGGRRRLGSGRRTAQLAMLHELSYLLFNGIALRARYDYSDYDTDLQGDHYNRIAMGTDLTLLPGLAITALFRVRLNAGPQARTTPDGIFYLRAWY